MAGKVVAPAIRICGNKSTAKGSIALSPEEKERWFWSKVLIKNGCWEWPRLSNTGYGGLRVNGKFILAHRFAWMLTFGPIPDGKLVCHHCDNPPCCNPEHLFLGTKLDNYKDMESKGRDRKAQGERQWYHKLTNAEVERLIEMRRNGNTYVSIARVFGLHKSTVYGICKGRTWRHLKICA